jgi:predicted AAA+ superfamily ATPase
MFHRVSKPLKSKSFFLFGARGVGKSTFISNYFNEDRTLVFDLLDPELEDQFILEPKKLSAEILAKKSEIDWVIIDEIQKCPKLLNIVHQLIVKHKIRFALTGSSARRLKQKGVNLLAGRAITEYMFPLTFLELGEQFNLDTVLSFGSMPEAISAESEQERSAYLRSYTLNYIKSEIQAEQWVRNVDPFRKFLGIAAQMNGCILNYSNMARDIGVQANTVQSYFDILEDTLIGIRIPAYDRSIRKQMRMAPKFYLFDLGIKRALDKTLDVRLAPGTSSYGSTFEHLVIMEIYRLSQYKRPDYTLSYIMTKDGAEIDLVVDRPGQPTALIEIKSKDKVDDRDTRHLEHFYGDFKKPDLILLSNDPREKLIHKTRAMHWKKGICEILGITR